MKRLLTLATAGLLLALAPAAQPVVAKATTPPNAEEVARAQQVKAILDGLKPQTGDVKLPGADAVLHLGDDYYYLAPDDARKVLIDAWRNHPDSARGLLGMVFPKGKTFLDDTWGAVLTFDASGYVSDEDAQSADYDQLLADIQSTEADMNARRAEQGYPAQHLVGWAQPPVYDPRTHSVVWAQNIQFSDQPVNALNYDVRLLGRRGVLSMNMITAMPKLAETKQAAARFAQSAEFNPGARYADFKSGDAVAEYGVGGLVAAGLGVAAAKKLGLLGIILAFGKKFILLILVAGGALLAFARKLFGRKEEEAEDYEPAYYEETPAGGDGDEAAAADTEPRPSPTA